MESNLNSLIVLLYIRWKIQTYNITFSSVQFTKLLESYAEFRLFNKVKNLII